jgi:diguanylate cyclase (GGDEF)-like protein
MEIYGVDPATFKMSRESVFDRIHPDDRALVDKDYRDAVANRTSFGTDHRIVMDNGAVKFVHTAGRVFYDAERKCIYSMGTLQDITQRKETEAKLLFANILLSAEMEAAPDGVLVVDADDHVISYNQRFATMWNVAPPTLAAAKDAPILAKVTSMMKDPEQFLALVQHLYAHPLEGGEDELKTVDGKFIQRFTTGLRAETGESLGRVWFFRDVTARRLAEASVLRLARFDVLTGLANRAIAVEAIQQASAQSVRNGTTFAVIYLDLDHFKDVNDTLGHPVGDVLLCSVAQRLRSNTRLTDTVARFGGDEFAIIAADIREPADAGALAGNLLQAVGELFLIEGNAIHIGASIGIEMRGSIDPRLGRSLDLSQCALRSVSPIHLEYLGNMGVTASMSLSLIVDGELWGLVACHHSTGRHFVPRRLRVGLALFSQMASFLLATKIADEELSAVRKRRVVSDDLLTQLAGDDPIIESLTQLRPKLLEIIEASGLGSKGAFWASAARRNPKK